MKNVKGITLVALVITIVVLLILSAVTISLTLGERGVFNLAQKSGSESNKAEATEKVNLKITQAQMSSYIKEQRLPSLQELAIILDADEEIQYVATGKKVKIASIEEVNGVSLKDATSIFTKLNKYPYEFEIDSSLRLASIDGIKLATTTNLDDTIDINTYNQVVNKSNRIGKLLWSGEWSNQSITVQGISSYSVCIAMGQNGYIGLFNPSSGCICLNRNIYYSSTAIDQLQMFCKHYTLSSDTLTFTGGAYYCVDAGSSSWTSNSTISKKQDTDLITSIYGLF